MWSVSDLASVRWSADSNNIECIPLEVIDDPCTVYASCTGPDSGLCTVSGSRLLDHRDTSRERSLEAGDSDDLVAGAKSWTAGDRRTFGISLSLYEQNPLTQKLSGEPIADTYAVCARKNSAILVIADGVNWGDKSKLAARCAVYGAMNYLNRCLSCSSTVLQSSEDAFRHLHDAMVAAHSTILEQNGGLTTFCAALVLPVSHNFNDVVDDGKEPPSPPRDPRHCPRDGRRYAVCTINVGDSLAFVFSRRAGLREVTVGSHDLRRARDVRDAGGALGPVDGCSPALDNLTYSLTLAEEGDIVFLTTDGVTDNFDPVVTKLASPAEEKDNNDGIMAADSGSFSRSEATSAEATGHADASGRRWRPELVMLPHERHLLAVKSMEMSVHEFELGKGRGSGGRCGNGRGSGRDVSAYELCVAVMQRVVLLTDSKRLAIEGSSLFRPRPGGKKPSRHERQEAEAEVRRQLALCPGKLDHATIAAYEVGERKEPTAVQSTTLLDGIENLADGAAPSLALRRYLASASSPSATACLPSQSPLIPTRY